MKNVVSFLFLVFTAARISAQPLVIAATAQTGCPPLCATFTCNYSSSPGSFSWDMDDGNPPVLQSGVPYCYSTPGSYTISLTYTPVSGPALQDTFVVTVINDPPAAFSWSQNGNTVTFTNLTPGNPSCQWWITDTLGVNLVASMQGATPSATLSPNTAYLVCLDAIGTGGCEDTVCQVITTGPTGMNEYTLSGVRVLPAVSADGVFSIDLPAGNEHYTASFCDAAGRSVRRDLLPAGHSVLETALAPGFYLLEIRAGNRSAQQRIVVTGN